MTGQGPDPIPLLDLRAQYATIKPDIASAIQRVLDRGDFVLGEAVGAFEASFAEFIGTKHSVGVATGFDALQLAMRSLDIGPGDEVILPANTFIATPLGVTAAGARPVLVDCQTDSFNIDPEKIEQAITPRTRALIPVHLTGESADMDPIIDIAKRHGLLVVEDAAQAHGARYKGRGCGTLGAAGCFSFYPGKNLGAYGDGGAVTTDDPDVAERLKRLRSYGQRTKYEHVEPGVNARLDSIQAAVLGVKLPHLAEWNARRAAHAAAYREALDGIGDIVVPAEHDYSTHVYHLFMVQTARRDALRSHLAADGIGTGIHYPIPIHLQEVYGGLGHKRGDFPVAEAYADRILSLPMFAELGPEQVARVVDSIRAFFAKA